MSPKKILLAEDDSDDSILFHEYLQDRTDIVLLPTVENGIELFEYLYKTSKKHLPDLIILDQNMPKKNGIQTLIELKADKAYSDIPVVVYSTYTDNQLIKACTVKGARMVVSKPLTRKGYQEMMDDFLSNL